MKVPLSNKIFISYSHKDEAWKDRLLDHLKVLEMEDYCTLWDDRKIEPGDEWYPQIEKALNEAQVVIMLISANFLTSEFILEEEVPRILERRGKDEVWVIPLIIKPCAWEKELNLLTKAWADPHTHVLTLVAWGGVGKTALVNHWLNIMERKDYCGAQRVYGWSFYSQGAAEGKQASADEFMHTTLDWFGDRDPSVGSGVEKGRRLANLIRKEKTLLILDDLEPLQYPPGELHGLTAC